MVKNNVAYLAMAEMVSSVIGHRRPPPREGVFTGGGLNFPSKI